MLTLPKIGTYSAIILSDENPGKLYKKKAPKKRGRKRNKGHYLVAFVEHD
jgi:hypothetical protein